MQLHQPVKQAWFFWLRVCLVSALAASGASGQGAETEVRGQLHGFENEPLGEVSLVFHHIGLNQQRRLQSDSQGSFAGQRFPAGRYRIAILQQGQILWVISGAELRAESSPVVLNINLRELRRAAEASPALDTELEGRLRRHEEKQSRRDQVREHYRKGLEALGQQDYPVAIRELEAARDLEPSEALYPAQLGTAYAGAGRSTDALATYERALALDSADTGTRNNLGVALARAGRTEEAVAAFELAARGGGDQAFSIYFNWGATLYNAGRYAEAVERLRQATGRENPDPMAFYFLGECLFRTSAVRSEGGSQKIQPLPGTAEAFQRYLELAPAGPYAHQAADYLKRLGAPVAR